jgi:hypothetical protein
MHSNAYGAFMCCRMLRIRAAGKMVAKMRIPVERNSLPFDVHYLPFAEFTSEVDIEEDLGTEVKGRTLC